MRKCKQIKNINKKIKVWKLKRDAYSLLGLSDKVRETERLYTSWKAI